MRLRHVTLNDDAARRVVSQHLAEAGGPRWHFDYLNAEHDPQPDVLVLGTFDNPYTDNELIGGINLHYLDGEQLERLRRAMPDLLRGGDLKRRYRIGKVILPDIFDEYYRTYDTKYIRAIKPDQLDKWEPRPTQPTRRPPVSPPVAQPAQQPQQPAPQPQQPAPQPQQPAPQPTAFPAPTQPTRRPPVSPPAQQPQQPAPQPTAVPAAFPAPTRPIQRQPAPQPTAVPAAFPAPTRPIQRQPAPQPTAVPAAFPAPTRPIQRQPAPQPQATPYDAGLPPTPAEPDLSQVDIAALANAYKQRVAAQQQAKVQEVEQQARQAAVKRLEQERAKNLQDLSIPSDEDPLAPAESIRYWSPVHRRYITESVRLT